jgi:archaellum component FlaC
MKKISKEHRVLDDTDLNNINNTFREIKHDFNNTFKEIKHDNNNNFNRIDNTFKLIEKTCESMNARIDSVKWLLGFLVTVTTTVFVSGLIALLIKLFF